MRGALVDELTQPPRPADIDDVEGVAVVAVALNPIDMAVGSGVFYGGHPPLPYVPGCEAAARTDDGTLVYLFGGGRGIRSNGFAAERVDAPDDLRLTLPDGTDPAVAAALGIAGVAGWVPIAKAQVTSEDRVLVLGASGAVGRIAVQAAKLLGAHVIAVGRDPSRLVDVGADETAPLDDVPEGWTVCIDPLWGEPLARVLERAALHARVVHVGQSAGPEAPLRSADVRGKELHIMGHSNFAMPKEQRDRAYLDLLAHVNAGRITVAVERYPLDRVGDAWERQRSGPGAKLVVEL